MMIASSAPKQIPVGLGAVIDPVTKAFSYPWYCSLGVFGWTDACATATTAQIAASAAADLTGAAATQANKDAITAGVYQQVANDCAGLNTAEDQASCLEYKMSQDCPRLSLVVGTGGFGQALCNFDPTGTKLPWILAAVAAGAIYLFARK